MPAMPYDGIAEGPDNYYDCSKYQLPVKLKLISELSPSSVTALAEYLQRQFGSKCPEGSSFVFRTKEDIATRIGKAGEEGEEGIDVGANPKYVMNGTSNQGTH